MYMYSIADILLRVYYCINAKNNVHIEWNDTALHCTARHGATERKPEAGPVPVSLIKVTPIYTLEAAFVSKF